MINKIAGVTLLLFAWLFATFWCFNHINAWVGIGAFILGIYISAKQIFKTNKKSEQ